MEDWDELAEGWFRQERIAAAVLMSMLTAEQRHTWKRSKWFICFGRRRTFGRKPYRYQVRPDYRLNVVQIDPKGGIVAFLCDPFPKSCIAPLERFVLSQKLLIESDEAALIRRSIAKASCRSSGAFPPL